MNEFEAKIVEKLMTENSELKTNLNNAERGSSRQWELQSERDKLKKRVTALEAVLTPKQRKKVDANGT